MRKVKLKKFLTSPIKDLFSLDSVSTLTDTASEVFELSETLQKQDVQDIHTLLENSASLLDFLATPEGELVKSLLPFANISTALIKYFKNKNKPKTAIECILLTCIQVYSRSLIRFSGEYQKLQKRSNKNTKKDKFFIENLELKIDQELEIDKREAGETLKKFPISYLAGILRKITVELLEKKGISPQDSKLLVEKAIWNSHRYITELWAEMPDNIREFNSGSLSDWIEELDRYADLDKYLEDFSSEINENIIYDEKEPLVTLENIYVPLKISEIFIEDHEDVDYHSIHEWTKKNLFDGSKTKKIFFIQSKPGRGKTAFLKMFFVEILNDISPIFTPVFIELNRIDTVGSNLNKTLQSCVSDFIFFRSNENWLDDSNTRFLILMDGLDELVLRDRELANKFLKQVLAFQKRNHHQIIITSRKWLSEELKLIKDESFKCIEIQPMSNELQQVWLDRWSTSISDSEFKSKFNQFISLVSKDIAELLQEPLHLYLLAKLYKENSISEKFLTTIDNHTVTKIDIYKEILAWVLSQQAETETLNSIQGLKTEDLYELLEEAAICIFQTGGKYEKIAALESRFEENSKNPVKKLIQPTSEANDNNDTNRNKSQALNNLIISFHINSDEPQSLGNFEFSNNIFWEFLFSERLVKTLRKWAGYTKSYHNESLSFSGESENLTNRNWQIFDLLGCGQLTDGIVEYVRGLINNLGPSNIIEIFNFLYTFYEFWSDGKYIDFYEKEEYCRRKAKQISSLSKNTIVRIRYIDLCTGLNVIILLSEINRYIQLNKLDDSGQLCFHPCKRMKALTLNEDEKGKFSRIIGYSYCNSLGVADNTTNSFSKLAGPFLSYIDLSSSNLRNCNLGGANFQCSKFHSTDMIGINLRDANLTNADLTNAKLQNSNFSGASLCYSKLINANFRFANFSNTDLSKADLTDKFAAEQEEIDEEEIDNSISDEDSDNENISLEDADLRNDYFSGTNFHHASLIEANLSYRRLSGADFSGADFSNAILDDIEPNDANFDGANLRHHSLDNLNFSGSNLNNADLTGSSMVAVDLSGVSLSGAILMGTNLSSGFLEGANFEGANLTGANLRNAHLVGANLNNADLTGADLTEADLNHIRYNSATKWKHAKGLKNARNFPTDWTC